MSTIRCFESPGEHWIIEHELLYLPTQIRFLIGGERVTCHWSRLHDALGRTKLHDALGQQQLELSTHTWSGRAPLKRRQICTPADVKQISFICVLFYFELGGITKHLMTGPSGNSELCFPSTSMFPSASPPGTLRVSGKQNSLFPLGPVIKYLLSLVLTPKCDRNQRFFMKCIWNLKRFFIRKKKRILESLKFPCGYAEFVLLVYPEL